MTSDLLAVRQGSEPPDPHSDPPPRRGLLRGLRRPAVCAAFVFLSAGALAGCGTDDDEDGEVTVATPSAAPSLAPPPPPQKELSPTDRMSFVTHLQQGLELARLFEAERALAEFESCLALQEGHAEARFHRARMLLRLGPADEALALLEELAARETPWLPALRLLNARYRPGSAHADPARRAALAGPVHRTFGPLGEFDLKLENWLTTGAGPSPCASLARRAVPPGPPPPGNPLARLQYSYSRRFDMGRPARSWEEDHDRNAQVARVFRGLADEFPGLAALFVEHAMWLLKSQVRFPLVERTDQPPLSSSIVLDIALQYVERALDVCALDSPLAHYCLLGLGHVHRDMGDFDQAGQDYELLLAQPGLSSRFQFEARFNLGLVHYRAGNIEKAKPHLEACAAVRNGPMVAWLLALCGGAALPLRSEPVTDEHRRTLEFVDRAVELGVAKFDGAGPSAWSDFDLDGDLDLFVSGCDTFSILYRNDGGRFTDVSRAAGLEDVASGFSSTFADYDNDGDDDLYIGRNGWSGPALNSLFENQGNGQFVDVTAKAGLEVPGSTFVHGWADFDRDGNLDLFLANGITGDGSTNALFHNNGDGTFDDVTAPSGLAEKPGTQTIGFAIGDYDRDGWPDLFVNSWNTRNRLYHNRGDGTFEEVATAAGVDGRAHPMWGYVAFFADFDNDTWPDILLTKISKFGTVLEGMLSDYEPNPRVLDLATKYYHNQGDGTFEDRSEAAGLLYSHGTMGANVGDLNNDGNLDFYLGTGDPMLARLEPNAFYVNTGDGTFADLTRFTGLGHVGKGHGITFADYDYDGDLDVYAPQGGFVHGDLWHNAFYVNERGNVNHWLAVQLVGTKSNRMGVGTQLTLFAGDLVLYREMQAGGAFGSSNGPFVHFGLGSHAAIDRLEILWPSGEEATFADLSVDAYFRLTEGAPEASRLPFVPRASTSPADALRRAIAKLPAYEGTETMLRDRALGLEVVAELEAIVRGEEPTSTAPDDVRRSALRWLGHAQNLLGNHARANRNAPGAVQDYRKAVAVYDAALRVDPDDAWTHYGRAMALHNLGQHGSAIDGYTRALALEPTHWKALHWRGHTRTLQRDYVAASEDFRRALDLHRDASTLHLLGIAQRGAREFAAAAETYRSIVKDEPRDSEAWLQLGYLAALRGDGEEAVRLLREAIARETAPLLYARIFLWIFAEGTERDEAEADLRYLLENGPIPGAWDRTLVAFLLGGTPEADFLGLADAEVGRREREGLPLDDLLCEVWYFAGIRRERDGDARAAREAFQRAVDEAARNKWEWEYSARRLESSDD